MTREKKIQPKNELEVKFPIPVFSISNNFELLLVAETWLSDAFPDCAVAGLG